MFETLILFGVVLLTQFMKKYVAPQWGPTGVHVLTFVISFAGVGIYQYAQSNSDFMEILMQALNYLAMAIAVYEIILKKIGFKTTKQLEKENS